MIEVIKITHNICDEAVSPNLSFYARASTRGNNYKPVNHSFHYDLHRHFFLHVLQIFEIFSKIQLLMLALLMHLKHGWISFGRTKKLNMILQLTSPEQKTDQKKF